MEDKNFNSQPHSLVLEDRKHMTLSGVRDVESFDEQNIIAVTCMGEITISGSSLKINRFSNDVGELAVDGEICAVSYSDNVQTEGGFFRRIFR